MNLPEEVDAAAYLPPPPPPDRSSSGGNGNNGSSEIEMAETFGSTQASEQHQSTKKARLKTTKDDDEDFFIEYRRLEMALVTAKEEYEAADKEFQMCNYENYAIDKESLHDQRWFEYEEDRLLFQETRALEVKSSILYGKQCDMSFDMICFKLRHNIALESETILTEWNREAFPHGYSNRMGQALLQNTQVTALTLVTSMMLPFYSWWDSDQALAYIDPMLCFIETSHYLRHVQVKSKYGSVDDLYSYGNASTENDNAMARAVFSEIVANPAIEHVQCEWTLSEGLLFAFMNKAKSIKVLDIDFRFRYYRDEVVNWDWMGPALSAAGVAVTDNTLERLTLQNMAKCPNIAMIFLENLKNWAAALIELTLVGCPRISSSKSDSVAAASLRFWQALATLLQSHDAAPMLQSLRLAGTQFDAQSMMLLLHGLCSTDSAEMRSAITLYKLSFSNCIWDQEALDILLNWMHTPIGSNDTAIATSKCRGPGGDCLWSLRELHFDDLTDAAFGDAKAVPTIARMLLLQTSTNTPVSSSGNDGDGLIATIGSQICTLSLGRFATTGRGNSHLDVLSRLSRSKERVQLSAVRLDKADVRDCRRLRQILPKLPSIRELHIGRLSNPLDCRPIVFAMMRENVRLGTFSCDDESTVFTAPKLRLVKAYQERNQFLCRHFLNKSLEAIVPLDFKTDEATTITEAKMDDNVAATSSNPQRLGSSLYPPLFQVAEPVLASQQWHIPFRGLFMLGEAIGSAIPDES